MHESTIEDKFVIFISSKIDDRYNIVRKALKRLLLETSMVASVYAFETEGASSQNVKSAYLGKVDTSDVCVFLIDNHDKVSDAVMAEHERAKDANVHRLYFFCDEKDKTPTSLQNELMASGEVKYNNKIHEFSDFPTEVYKSVLQDIIDYYKCTKVIYDTSNHLAAPILIPVNTLTLNKQIYKNYASDSVLTRGFDPYASNNTIDVMENPDGYDNICSVFLTTLLGRTKFDKKRFLQLKNKILSDHQENVRSIIEARLCAVSDYFVGNFEDCSLKINEAYEMAKIDSTLPQWLLNDIVIDMRNVNSMDAERNNRFALDTNAQKILEDSPETVYYPLLDRFAEKSNERLLVEFFEKHTESPYSWRCSSLNLFFENISSCFNISVRFGSLSHILLIREKYASILFSLYIGENDIRLFVELLKMYLLLEDDKHLSKICDTYKQSVSAVTAIDIEVLIKSINTISVEYKRSISHCLLLEYLGYYFSEEKYAKEIEVFMKYAFAWCVDEKKIVDAGRFILKTITANIRRMNNQKIAELIICFFENHIRRFYREVLRIASYLDYSMISSSEHIRIFESYVALVQENNFTDKNFFQRAVLSLRQNAKNDLQETIDKFVKSNMPEFYNGEYDLEVNSLNSRSHIAHYLNIAKDRNKDASVNKYSGFAWSPFSIITNIIKMDALILSNEEIAEVIAVIKETLLNRVQQGDQKNTAILLVLFLKHNFPDFPSWDVFIKEINENNEDILSATSDHIFATSSLNTLSFNVLLLRISFEICTYEEVAIGFASVMNYGESDFINITKNLYALLESVIFINIDRNIRGTIVSFILSIGSGRHKDAQLYAAKSLILLSQDDIYGAIVLERLAYLMDSAVSETKLSILYNIKNLTLRNTSIVDYIVQKGRTDNHYLVRKIAEEITNTKHNS